VGAEVGGKVGPFVRGHVGAIVGSGDGAFDHNTVGEEVVGMVGLFVGGHVEAIVGSGDGGGDGTTVGVGVHGIRTVGTVVSGKIGAAVGALDGCVVGKAVIYTTRFPELTLDGSGVGDAVRLFKSSSMASSRASSLESDSRLPDLVLLDLDSADVSSPDFLDSLDVFGLLDLLDWASESLEFLDLLVLFDFCSDLVGFLDASDLLPP
jgi:hypothetical protein